MSNARLFLGALTAIALAACGSADPVLPAGAAEHRRPALSTVVAGDTTQNTTSLGQLGSGNKADPVQTVDPATS